MKSGKGKGNKRKHITDAQRVKRVQPLLNYWVDRLGTGGTWHISYRFKAEINDHKVFAETYQNLPYHKGTVIFDSVCVDAATKEELESAVIHELMHLLLSPMGECLHSQFGNTGYVGKILDDAQEECCENLAEALMHLRYGHNRAYHDPLLFSDVVAVPES